MVSDIISKNNKTISLLLLQLILMIIAFRPIIDLQGRFEGNAINLGGAVGLLITFGVTIFFILSNKKKDPLLNIILYALIFIVLLWFINVIDESRKHLILIDFSRFIVGFSPIILLFSINFIEESFSVKKFYYFYILTCTVPIIIAFLQYFGQIPHTYFDVVDGSWVGRPSGGYIQPSSLSRLMIFSTLITYILSSSSKISNVNKYSIVFISVITTLLSTHRTATFILLLIIISFEIFSFLKEDKNKRIKIMMLLNITSLFGVLLLINNKFNFISLNLIRDSMSVMTGAIGSLNINDESFLRGRGFRWEKTLEYMSNLSFGEKLIGEGYAVFESHNDLLNTYLVTGIMGVILFSTVYISLFIYVWRRVNTIGRFSLTILYIVLILFGITLQPSTYPNFMWMFIVSLIIILIVNKKDILRDGKSIRTSLTLSTTFHNKGINPK